MEKQEDIPAIQDLIKQFATDVVDKGLREMRKELFDYARELMEAGRSGCPTDNDFCCADFITMMTSPYVARTYFGESYEGKPQQILLFNKPLYCCPFCGRKV